MDGIEPVTSATLAVPPAPLPLDHGCANCHRPATGITEQIRRHGSVCLCVRGMSMFPWIRSGDLVFVRRCSFAAVKPGDVVLFEQAGRYFVHRVLRRMRTGDQARESLLLTKGDALDGTDAPMSPAQFLGRAIRIHRGRRHIDLQSLAHIILGRILAHLSPASLLLYGPLRMGRRLFAGAQAI